MVSIEEKQSIIKTQLRYAELNLQIVEEQIIDLSESIEQYEKYLMTQIKKIDPDEDWEGVNAYFEKKYLKYKKKYLELKHKLNKF
jgi:hypothetical protein